MVIVVNNGTIKMRRNGYKMQLLWYRALVEALPYKWKEMQQMQKDELLQGSLQEYAKAQTRPEVAMRKHGSAQGPTGREALHNRIKVH